MSNGPPTDEEVAEDYKYSLEFLTTNDRYAINNLTVIARENTEHAPAISKVLEAHIRKVKSNFRFTLFTFAIDIIRHTPPDRKLPALYVLDSIAKNIGTPYNLFLGQNLYSTFMDAYSLVDTGVRKKLDEMLKTWKNPVPGSQETRPVFPPDITKRIENALIQAKTATLRQQQQQAQNQENMLRRRFPTMKPSMPYQNTPTPPQNSSCYPPPTPQPYMQYNQASNGHPQTRSPYPQYFQATPQSSGPSPYQEQLPPSSMPAHYRHSSVDIESLHRDIEHLISAAKAEFASNIHDTAVQIRLKALLDLQSILTSQQLPPDQLQQIRDQVAQLSANARPVPPPTVSLPATSTPVYAYTPSLSNRNPYPPVYQQTQSATPPIPAVTTLADLLASAARNKAPPPPPPQLTQPPVPQPTSLAALLQAQPQSSLPSTNAAPLSNGNPTSLLASLRAAGILSSAGGVSTPSASIAAPTPVSYPTPSSTIQPATQTPYSQFLNVVRPPLTEARNDIQLTSASLKQPRPHLISKLYEARPNQCSTCGKRFLMTKEDRDKKSSHLDWHFRTNRRLTESANRGQSRSWYVDEMEWIKSRGNEDDGTNASAQGSKDSKVLAAAAAAKNDPKNQFIPVPSETALANAPCPICQEKFDTSWHNESQDFVWMDAIKIGSRVYHASCHAELKQDGTTTPLGRMSTPDSVLGKRKAEVSISNPLPVKIQKEIVA
ncbi:hypothetical protein MMC14_002117 [Varicellaria rhodocarpa]|nr:hypothetical protein [Varicellaria rhodocarpa]